MTSLTCGEEREMDKNRQSKRMSELLGFSLLFSMALLWLCALCLNYAEIESENLYLFVVLLSKLPIFGLPVLFVRLSAAKLEIPMPRLSPGTQGSKRFLICVSSVGVIVLIQILYSALFPSAIAEMGVSASTTPLGYALMFAVYVVLPAVFEELFFRGTVMRALTVHRKLLALMVSALSFALMHFSIERFPIAFFCGLILGIAYLSTGSLGCAIFIHLFCNAIWYAVEIVRTLFASYYPTFMRIVFAACVLMIAAGMPVLKTTLGTVSGEDDEQAVSSAYFWSFPYIVFLVTAALVQVFWRGLE